MVTINKEDINLTSLYDDIFCYSTVEDDRDICSFRSPVINFPFLSSKWELQILSQVSYTSLKIFTYAQQKSIKENCL